MRLWGQMLTWKHVNPDMMKYGAVYYEDSDMWYKNRILTSFALNRIAPNADFAFRLLVLNQFREGGSLRDMNGSQFTDRVLQELVTNLLIRDAKALYKDLPPEQATAIMMIILGGGNVLAGESDLDRAIARMIEKNRKYQGQ